MKNSFKTVLVTSKKINRGFWWRAPGLPGLVGGLISNDVEKTVLRSCAVLNAVGLFIRHTIIWSSVGIDPPSEHS